MSIHSIYFFTDGCSLNPCPADASCVNITGECKCQKFAFEYERGKCIKKEVKVVKVKGVKFKKPYNPKYGDKNSTEFKVISTTIETLLEITICSRIHCIDIVIVSITNGSINVEFNVVFPSNATSATASDVTTATKQALSDPRLQSLKPDVNSVPTANGKYLTLVCHFWKLYLDPLSFYVL